MIFILVLVLQIPFRAVVFKNFYFCRIMKSRHYSLCQRKKPKQDNECDEDTSADSFSGSNF